MAADRKLGDIVQPNDWGLRPLRIETWVKANPGALDLDVTRFLRALTFSTFKDTAGPINLARKFFGPEPAHPEHFIGNLVPQWQANVEARAAWMLSKNHLPQRTQESLKAVYDLSIRKDWTKEEDMVAVHGAWEAAYRRLTFAIEAQPGLKGDLAFYYLTYPQVGAAIREAGVNI